MPSTNVALLRGINVGGKNKLAMPALVAEFERAGCRAVRTYIQSGNVLFEAPASVVARLAARLADSLEKRFGLRLVPVLRTAVEFERAAAGNPFLRRGIDPKFLHVAFLADRPKPAALRSLDPHRSPPDEFEVAGREIYLHCPGGVARTRLTNAYFDARLSTTTTVRNWRTVTKLVEMARA